MSTTLFTSNQIGGNLIAGYTPGILRNNFTGYVGLKFTVGASEIVVNGLGAYMGISADTSTVVYLCSFTAVLTSATVSFSGGIVGDWHYASISPVTLTPNTTYYLIAGVTSGGVQWNDTGAVALSASIASGPSSVFSTGLADFTAETVGQSYFGLDLLVAPLGTSGSGSTSGGSSTTPSPTTSSATSTTTSTTTSSTTSSTSVVMPPTFPDPATGEIGAILIRSDTAATPAVYVTNGVAFAKGTVPSGSTVSLAAGTAQLDVHTTWPDGSVRFASLTTLAPALADGADTFQMLSATPLPTTAPAAVVPQLEAGAVTVAFQIAGVSYSYDVANLLATASSSKWMSGPLATEVRIIQPVISFLRLVIDVRCYADGTYRVIVGFNADLAFSPTSPAATLTSIGGSVGWQSLTFESIEINQAGTAVLQIASLTQYQYQVWCWTVDGRPAAPEMLLDQRVYIASGLLPRFNLTLGVNETTIATYYSSMTAANGFAFPVTPPVAGSYPTPVPTLSWGGLTLYMGTTGGRNDIGMMTDACSAWAMTYDVRMRDYCLAQAEGAKSCPWHLFVEANNRYINVIDYPKLWTSIQSTEGGLTTSLPSDQQIDGSPWSLDAAHMPNASVAPYLFTGDHHYLDDILAQASWCIMNINNRGTPPDLVIGPIQGREQAWCLRAIGYAMLLADNANLLLPCMEQAVTDSLTYALTLGAGEGELSTYWPTGSDLVAPWQNDFQDLPLVMLSDCGVASATQNLINRAGFTAGRFITTPEWPNASNGFGYYFTVASTIDGATTLNTTWAEVLVALVAGNLAISGSAIAQPPNSSAQYVAGARQSLIQTNRIVGSAVTAAALAFVQEAAIALGAGDSFAQGMPSFAVTG